MRRIAIAIHGGAGKTTSYLKKHKQESYEGLEEAIYTGYERLKKGRSALSAVEAAIIKLEDNPYFNAGKGSVLNNQGKVEMDASIMDGKTLKAGAVSIVHSVKNPILLARHTLTKTKHVLLSAHGALDLARCHKIELRPASYFITEDQVQEFKKYRAKNRADHLHGTVGAVALDKNGNLAAATSTGGTSFSLPGRIGDSCIIGGGCYANNKTCAVSCTGEGEVLIVNVVAHSISMLYELKNMSVQKACEEVIHKRSLIRQGEMGVIALDHRGNFGITYNTHGMRYATIDTKGHATIANV